MKNHHGSALTLSLFIGLSSGFSFADEPFKRTEKRSRCSDFDPHRSPFFGDLHIHTSLSFDAVLASNFQNGPRAAYAFARGEPLGLPPFDADGRPIRKLRLSRPLDFAAVADHAEYLGEVDICFTPSHPGSDSEACEILRAPDFFGAGPTWFGMLSVEPPLRPERFGFCGPDDSGCLEVAASVWDHVRTAADEAYDTAPSCSFTTFVAYEWTRSPGGAHLHRNVIFRNHLVPKLPVSFFDAPSKEELWDALQTSCLDPNEGCDVLAIPHNPNMSLGAAFLPENTDGSPLSAADAKRRAAFEPLVEIFQGKGSSECRPGLGTSDELCGFELLRFPLGTPPLLPFGELSLVRNALKEGLVQQERIGVNPFQFGVIGSTDTHSSTGGATEEDNFQGHFGVFDASLPGRMSIPFLDANPGGLAVIWAEENSRDALFEGLRRREVYATSGTRPTVRFFGSFRFPEAVDLCRKTSLVPLGYALGVPMGGVLDPSAGARGKKPRFVVSALRDPGLPDKPGAPLERIQIIKGWVEDGEAKEAVFEVAGDAASENGSAALCTMWEDPDFDPDQPAFYYARVLEVATPRWSAIQCDAAGVDCSAPEGPPPGLEGCCDPLKPRTIQERAWTSPIYFTPENT